MNLLMNRNPFAELDDIFRSIERNFDPTWRHATPGFGFLPMDVYEKDNAFYIRASVPGLRQEELDVSVEKDVVTLKGMSQCEWDGEGTKVYLREHPYGSFTRSVRLPEGCRYDQAEAQFDRGIVTIRIPKAEPAAPTVRSIPIRQSLASGQPQAIEANAEPSEEPAKGKKQVEAKA